MVRYKHMRHKNGQGFTIVELLIVIVVIGILAAVTLVAYGAVQQRARDAKRAQDLASIQKALLLYNTNNSGVYASFNYASAGPGGWDSSVQANWLSFLRAAHGSMPVDPLNESTTDPTNGNDDWAYFYYCYNAGSGPLPASPNVRIGYRSERTGAYVDSRFAVERCL